MCSEGTAQTLVLYGRMKCRVMPVPNTACNQGCEIHSRLATGRALQLSQALLAHLLRQITKIVLERVWHPCVLKTDVGRAVVIVNIAVHHLLEQRVELSEMTEHDVTAEIPREPGRIED